MWLTGTDGNRMGLGLHPLLFVRSFFSDTSVEVFFRDLVRCLEPQGVSRTYGPLFPSGSLLITRRRRILRLRIWDCTSPLQGA